MKCVDCTEDELICAITQYPSITDAYGQDRRNPGPKVTRSKRRVSFALGIEKRTTFKPADYSDKEYFEHIADIRGSHWMKVALWRVWLSWCW